MIEKIAFFVFENLYSSKRAFTERLSEALRRREVEVKIFDIPEGVMTKEHLQTLYQFDPTLTLSFHTILPLPDGRFLWDQFKTPHVSLLLDPMIYYLNLIKSPYSILSYVDLADQALLERAGFENHFFFPHAIEKELLDEPLSRDREYEVTLIGSCYDHESVQVAWEKQYPKAVCQVIEESIQMTLCEQGQSFLESVVKVWEKSGLDPQLVDFQTVATYVDYYLRGYDRLKLLEALKDFRIDIFGSLFWVEGQSLNDWNYYTRKMDHVTVHEGVSFTESYHILRNSRVSLNSTPFFKNGSHERFLTAPALGSSVLASTNVFAKEQFGEEAGVRFYNFREWEKAPGQVAALLEDEEKRISDLEATREVIRSNFTWDRRAEELIETLPRFISKIHAKTLNPN